MEKNEKKEYSAFSPSIRKNAPKCCSILQKTFDNNVKLP